MVDCIEGWYLDSSSRIQYEVPSEKEMDKLGDMYLQTHRLMLDLGEGPAKLPDEYPEPCNDSAGCFWCKFGDEESGIEFLNSLEKLLLPFLHQAKKSVRFSHESMLKVNLQVNGDLYQIITQNLS